jgi:putative transposase
MTDDTRTRKESQVGRKEPEVITLRDFMVDTRGYLLEVGIKAGLAVMAEMFATDVEAICGQRYEHRKLRKATRWGVTNGEVVLGGKKVTVKRPRVRSSGHEVGLSTYERFRDNSPLTERVLEQILSGVSTRRYLRSLETTPFDFDMHGVSKSAVSRRFVMATAERIARWMDKPLDKLDIVALFMDGIALGDHMVVAAVGIDAEGYKYALGIWEGATENAVVCQALIDNLISRGLDADKILLFIIDGSKALRKAIRQSFGANAVIQRCQRHKMENVKGHLPKSLQMIVLQEMRRAYHSDEVNKARRILAGLIRRLEDAHPCAAASLAEGLEDTLTVIKLKLPRALGRSIETTNIVENAMSIVRHLTRNVKRWRNGKMVQRWAATGFMEAEKRFRRINGYKWIPQLLKALKEYRELDKEDAA